MRPRWQWSLRFLWLAVVVGILAFAFSLRETNPTPFPKSDPYAGFESHRSNASWEVSAGCDYAARSVPLHPATIGEAMDAQRALDIACREYRTCIKREDANLLPAYPEPPPLPDLHEH